MTVLHQLTRPAQVSCQQSEVWPPYVEFEPAVHVGVLKGAPRYVTRILGGIVGARASYSATCPTLSEA